MHGITTSADAAFDYAIHWPRGATLGVPIVASEWVSEPVGLTIEPGDPLDGRAPPDGRTGARVSAGRAGRYRLTNRVTLADDRTLVRHLALEVAA